MNADPIPSMRRRINLGSGRSGDQARLAVAGYLLRILLRVLIGNRGANPIRTNDERIDLLLGVKSEGPGGSRIRVEAWCVDERVTTVLDEATAIAAEIFARSPGDLVGRAHAPCLARAGNFVPYRIELSSSINGGGSVRCLLDDDTWRPDAVVPARFRTSEILVLLGRAANSVGTPIELPLEKRLNLCDRMVLEWCAFVALGGSPRLVFECISVDRDPEEWRMSGAQLQFDQLRST